MKREQRNFSTGQNTSKNVISIAVILTWLIKKANMHS